MTEPAYLAAVRESYDTVAADYVRTVITPAELDPLSRGMLGAFAELVRAERRPDRSYICLLARRPAQSNRGPVMPVNGKLG